MMRWRHLSPSIMTAGHYRIVRTPRGPSFSFTGYYRGVQFITTSDLNDAVALAEHHARPITQCPSLGCTSHFDATKEKI
jgi:hypothetical protein